MILPGNPESLRQLTVQVLPSPSSVEGSVSAADSSSSSRVRGEIQSSTHTLISNSSATDSPITTNSPRTTTLPDSKSYLLYLRVISTCITDKTTPLNNRNTNIKFTAEIFVCLRHSTLILIPGARN